MTTAPDLTQISKTLKQFPFPSRFAVELCADCNLRCAMCHHEQMCRPKGVMPFELWRKCADEIATVAPKTEVWFSFCGEPLMEPELLLKMVAYGKEVGLECINLNTNGMLLTPEFAGPLVDVGLSKIVFGVDGFSKEVYESIRIGGERETLYANIENLLAERAKRAEGPEVMVQFIVMDENEHELDTFREYWLARGATAKVRNQLSWGGKFDTPLTIDFENRIACPWAVTMMHVFWDGRVPRCPGDTEGDEGSGNAWHESLSSLWNRLGPYRDLHLSERFAELPERCQTCKDWMVGVAERERPTAGPAS